MIFKCLICLEICSVCFNSTTLLITDIITDIPVIIRYFMKYGSARVVLKAKRIFDFLNA